MLFGFVYRLVLAAVLLLAVTVGYALDIENGSPAPDFVLKSNSGENVRLSEHRGEVVLVSFWASWCGRCITQLNRLENVYQDFHDKDVLILSVNIDEDLSKADSFIRSSGASFPILFDADHEVSKLYDLGSMPLTLIIDRMGDVRFIDTDFRAGKEDTYSPQIRELLAE